MKLNELLRIRSIEGNFLIYIIGEYDRLINNSYNKVFVGRSSNLEILLSDKFNKIKNDVDLEMDKICNEFDNLDPLNLKACSPELEALAERVKKLSLYMEYLIGKMDPKHNSSDWNEYIE